MLASRFNFGVTRPHTLPKGDGKMNGTSNDNTSLALMSEASRMLVEASTIQQAKELKDLALTAADWARRKGMGDEAIQYARSYALRAERKMGEMLQSTDRAKGASAGGIKESPRGSYIVPRDTQPTLSELGVTKRESSEAQFLADLPDEDFEEVATGDKTIADAKREHKRKTIIDHLEDIELKEAKAIEGVYDVIVIDPPWPMKKIERDVTPNQVEFDYPTMSLEEIAELEVPCADSCHVWLWTTHKFMPAALSLLDGWGMSYVCAFVWHKPGGFQPFGLPQYNSEFALYARAGTPTFIDTKAFPVCFNAPRGAHSEKPGEFYSMIERVTAGRRLDMFGRREISGFDSWGKEA